MTFKSELSLSDADTPNDVTTTKIFDNLHVHHDRRNVQRRARGRHNELRAKHVRGARHSAQAQ